MIDSFQTIREENHAELKEKGSRFIAYAFPIADEAAFKNKLHALKKEHHQAVHHCSAMILGTSGEYQKFSDDREPSNSAGRPILRALLSHEVTHTAVIVVRYFGGKLLGVPGLIKAYHDSADQALSEAIKIQQPISIQYCIHAPLELEHEIFRLMKQTGNAITQHLRNERVSITFGVKPSEVESLIKRVNEYPQLILEKDATAFHN